MSALRTESPVLFEQDIWDAQESLRVAIASRPEVWLEDEERQQWDSLDAASRQQLLKERTEALLSEDRIEQEYRLEEHSLLETIVPLDRIVPVSQAIASALAYNVAVSPPHSSAALRQAIDQLDAVQRKAEALSAACEALKQERDSLLDTDRMLEFVLSYPDVPMRVRSVMGLDDPTVARQVGEVAAASTPGQAAYGIAALRGTFIWSPLLRPHVSRPGYVTDFAERLGRFQAACDVQKAIYQRLLDSVGAVGKSREDFRDAALRRCVQAIVDNADEDISNQELIDTICEILTIACRHRGIKVPATGNRDKRGVGKAGQGRLPRMVQDWLGEMNRDNSFPNQD